MWDLVRDGELTAGEYLDVVLPGVGSESEISVFQGLLGNVSTVLRRYTAPELAPAGWSRLASVAWHALLDAEPGSDRQLAWAHMVADAAGGTEVAGRLRALYHGEITVPGLELDLDARWRLLHGLVAHGLAGDEDIAAEHARERSSAAAVYAATARALRPYPDTKAEAWDLATGDNDLTAQLRKAYVDGWWHHAQAELLAPYVPRYFASLDEFWTRHGGAIVAKDLSLGLFPTIIDESTMDLADGWLARPDAPPAQRRLVLERRDELARALRNRATSRLAGITDHKGVPDRA
jgi:aminopeptidase N